VWHSVITFLSSPSAPYLFCGVIFLVFLYAVIEGLARLSAIRIAADRAMAIVESAPSATAFYEQFEALSDHFTKEPLFTNPWKEFAKTVVIDASRSLVRITRRPQDFFHSNGIIAPRINLRLYTAIPGYLISLGLFFTFIGLVAAIAIAADGLGKSANVTQTQEALVQLLDVASLKFISSVAGISLSIILSFLQKAWINKVTMRIHHFCSAVENRTQLMTTEQLLYQWLVVQEQTTRGYARLAEDVATEVTLQLNQSR
jgi:hypothetical protein